MADGAKIFWLPSLGCGQSTWRLPLADASLLALEAALLEPSAAARCRALERLLPCDPALFLWSVCQIDAGEGQQGVSCRRAAEWLSQHLVGAFKAVQPQGPDVVEAHIDRQRLAHLAAAGVAAGWAAARLALLDGRQDAEQARAAGLLHGAAQWRLSDPQAPADPEMSESGGCFPRWLARWLSDTDSGGLPSCAARAVRQVEGSLHSGSDEPPAAEALPAALLKQRYQAALAWWELLDEPVRWRLPRLVRKLTCLESLERDFSAALEAAKLDAMKELAYGASHEINNPLANISVRAQTLLRDEPHAERRRALAAIHSQAMRAHEMIADLMLYARPPALDRRGLDLAELAQAVVAELLPEADRRHVNLHWQEPQETLLVAADQVQLAVALRGLCVNALEAVDDGGQVVVAGRRRCHEGTWNVELEVTDNGPGIAPEIREKLFDPFFSGREAGRGLGFGLSKAWRIVTDHGGRIEVQVPPSGGACFVVALPARPG